MNKPTTITFSKGYERLQEIANEVNQTEIPVDVLGDRFAEGKGLEKALNDYLAGERARIEQIERGEEVQPFEVVSESQGNGQAESANGAAETSDNGDGDRLPF
jgi:exonuclease VII small subunit